MKNLHIKSLLIAVFLICSTASFAQNIPDGTQAPAGTPTAVALPIPFDASGAPSLFNYIRVWNPVKPITDTSVFAINALNVSPARTTYLNGWGQPLEVIKHGLFAGSRQSSDIILPMDGRHSLTKTTFLPYPISRNSHFQNEPFTAEMNYYGIQFPTEGATAASQQVLSYDGSGVPFATSYAPGSVFIGQGLGGVASGGFNRTNEIVKYSV
ncbi:MAG: hypothetical protein ACTHJ0_13075, partial [Flavipsychrobacter sp.]